MYKEHQPMIAEYARRGPTETARTLAFVVLSVRRSLEEIAPLMQQLPQVDNIVELQKDGLAYVWRHAESLHAAVSNPPEGRNDVNWLAEYLQIPGIGIVKAGFCTQLLYGRVGCLDRHNLQMYGLDKQAFNYVPVSTVALRSRLETYVQACERIGGSERLWNHWCAYVARLRPAKFASAEQVSACHYETITGDKLIYGRDGV